LDAELKTPPPIPKHGSGRKRKALWTVCIGLAGVICYVLFAYVLFPASTDLKVALGVERLPASLKRSHVHTQAFQNYVVCAYFEISPHDFETLLSARTYARREPDHKHVGGAWWPELAFDAAEMFEWERTVVRGVSTQAVARCSLYTDAGKTRVYLVYGAD
jgi:hypothetical protein